MRETSHVPPVVPTAPGTYVPSASATERPEGAPRLRKHARLLLAVDGSELAGHAARVALAIADALVGSVQVVNAMDTRGVPLPPPLDAAIGLADALVGPQVHEAQAAEVRAAMSAAVGRPVEWPVQVGLGAPAALIAREAERSAAELIVLGLRRHGALGRALQDETALAVMRQAACPVLGVTPSLAGLPRRVVVGVDFSRTSREAARLALDLLAPDGRLILAYVPVGPQWEPDEGEGYVHALGVDAAFAALTAELPVSDGRRIERAVIAEAPQRPLSDRLLRVAGEAEADLLVLGSRRYGRLLRWMIGSVTTDVARDGRMSLLVVPPRETREQAAGGEGI